MKNISSYIEGSDNILNCGFINYCLSALGHHSRTVLTLLPIMEIYRGFKAEEVI